MTILTKDQQMLSAVMSATEKKTTKRNVPSTKTKDDSHCTHVCPLQRPVQKKTQSVGSRGRHMTTRSRVSTERPSQPAWPRPL